MEMIGAFAGLHVLIPVLYWFFLSWNRWWLWELIVTMTLYLESTQLQDLLLAWIKQWPG